MKLKTQELIRGTYLGVSVGAGVLFSLLNRGVDIKEVDQVVQFLESSGIDLENISELFWRVYFLDSLASFRTQTMTSEYRELKGLYQTIIQNTAELYRSFGLNNPVSIFAMYVYMYRSGYFSYHKNFCYSVEMKDFAKLGGVDVVRGHGVCRSIANMLTDIYREMGMSSYNMSVHTNGEVISRLKHLCPVALQKTKSSRKFVRVVGDFTKVIPISNHMITMIESDGINYVFDPTNDGYLIYYNKRVFVANDVRYYMKDQSFGMVNTFSNLLGQFNDGIHPIRKYKQLQCPTVDYSWYERIYLDTLELVEKNRFWLEQFYQDNLETISSIYQISKNESGYVKRLIPMIKAGKRR